MDIFKSCWAWFRIAPWIWLPLIVGWVWVGVSWWIGFEFPSSGAILVCAAIIAEAFLLTWPHLVPFDVEKSPVIFDTSAEESDSPHLYTIAKDSEKDEHGKWVAWKTSRRVQRIFVTSIIVSAIVGTVIWGYGHLLAYQEICK